MKMVLLAHLEQDVEILGEEITWKEYIKLCTFMQIMQVNSYQRRIKQQYIIHVCFYIFLYDAVSVLDVRHN